MKLILYMVILFPTLLHSVEIKNVLVNKIGKLNCSLISTEVKKNPDYLGNFYDCEGFFLVEEGESLILIDPNSDTMRQQVIEINEKELSASTKKNDAGELYSIFRLTAFWNSSIKNQMLKKQILSLFLKAREKNILNRAAEEQALNKLVIINNKPTECQKVEKQNSHCPIYSCKGSESPDELLLFYYPNSNFNSLRSYNFTKQSSHFVDFKFEESQPSQINSPIRCEEERPEHKYGCQLSLSHLRSLELNCKTDQLKKIVNFDLKASEDYLTYKYTTLALELKDSAQKTLLSLGKDTPCNEKYDLGFDTSVMEQGLAESLMKEISTYDLNEKFPQNGCYERASVIANLIVTKYKMKPFKIFLSGDLTSKDSPNVNWGGHVATAIKVKNKNGDVQALVIDPLASKIKMLNISDWLDTVGVKASDIEKKISPINIQIAPYWSKEGEIRPFEKQTEEQIKCIACEFEWDRFEAIFNGVYGVDKIPD